MTSMDDERAQLTEDEIAESILRVRALVMERAARMLEVGATLARATISVRRLAAALREGAQQDEDDLLFRHPDMVDLDLADAHWRLEGDRG